jgi:hypothetical protein
VRLDKCGLQLRVVESKTSEHVRVFAWMIATRRHSSIAGEDAQLTAKFLSVNDQDYPNDSRVYSMTPLRHILPPSEQGLLESSPPDWPVE